jgi:hypothetical protein
MALAGLPGRCINIAFTSSRGLLRMHTRSDKHTLAHAQVCPSGQTRSVRVQTHTTDSHTRDIYRQTHCAQNSYVYTLIHQLEPIFVLTCEPNE